MGNLMRLLLILLTLTLPLVAENISEEEALYLRRIYALWEDKDYLFAKSQIEDFCAKFPESPLLERFTCMLGDIAFYEKDYSEALKQYAKISDETLKKTFSPKRWHALYQLKRFGELQLELSPELVKGSDEAKFYYAESLFRLGLTPTLETKKVKELWNEALSLYGELFESPIFSENAKIGSAEIYRLLGESKLAAQYYLELADLFKNRDGIKQEELLFHASVALKEYDEEKALSIASHLARFGLKRRKEGANLWFYLLVKGRRFDVLKENETLFLGTLADEKKGLYYYFLAKNELLEKNEKQASHFFEKSLHYHLHAPYLHEALIQLIELSEKADNVAQLESSIALFKSHFKESTEEIEHLNLRLAESYHQNNQSEKALALLDQMLENEPKLMLANLAKAKILFKLGKTKEAHHLSRQLMELYPNKKEVLRFSVTLAIDHLNVEADLQLIEEIEKALEVPDIFSREERQKLRLLIAQSYLALKHSAKASHLLKELALENFEPARTHFLLSLALLAEKDLEHGIEHGEKALKLDSSTFEVRKLHLHLFNAYLELAKSSFKAEIKEHAAEHLYAIINEMPVSLENRLWLATHYVKRCEMGFDREEAQKAIAILEPLFIEEGDFVKFESLSLTLATLYEITSQFEKEERLIENLYALNSSLQHASLVKLKRGDLLEYKGELAKASALYKELENDPNPYVSGNARLKMARLFFAALDPETKDSSEVQHALHLLKDLKTKRVLSLEPLHLEAAIDYAEISASMQKPSRRKKALLQNLIQLKEEFLAKDDIASKDYHLSFEMMPEKAHLFASYMRYLDARIYQLQAYFCKEAGEVREGNTKERAALALFSSLRQGKYAMTRYIQEKSKVAMK